MTSRFYEIDPNMTSAFQKLDSVEIQAQMCANQSQVLHERLVPLEKTAAESIYIETPVQPQRQVGLPPNAQEVAAAQGVTAGSPMTHAPAAQGVNPLESVNAGQAAMAQRASAGDSPINPMMALGQQRPRTPDRNNQLPLNFSHHPWTCRDRGSTMLTPAPMVSNCPAAVQPGWW